jgi:hypothetical protein
VNFRKLILALFTFAMLATATYAQNNKKDEIEALKVAFITKRLNLSPDEARVFWPVYNQYQNEIQALRKKNRIELKDAKENFESLSDKDIEKLIDNEIVFKQNELDLLKKYQPQLKKTLSIRKVALLYKAEEDFKKELLKRIRENRS